MIQEAEDILWQDLMWVGQKKDRFEIDLDSMQDDLSLAARGASWVTNEANGMKDKTQWMMDRILKAPKDQQLWDRKGNTWRMTRVCGYSCGPKVSTGSVHNSQLDCRNLPSTMYLYPSTRVENVHA
ncbi:hypothetical protein VC83_08080 [Pseudogymnoascus destructans]|uniref:Uncharacterized protein n=1 Tax=Pseudogymnoascus destructans TaxID=655981 RepID=A0A177A1L1_9PEZI|nr:uncharacterized protein VC83_08080 [Pseudogymnoascus destructans]OAF55977.1 hypothetical protein VC83_08080 [Pseudogymnoascus destructans]